MSFQVQIAAIQKLAKTTRDAHGDLTRYVDILRDTRSNFVSVDRVLKEHHPDVMRKLGLMASASTTMSETVKKNVTDTHDEVNAKTSRVQDLLKEISSNDSDLGKYVTAVENAVKTQLDIESHGGPRNPYEFVTYQQIQSSLPVMNDIIKRFFGGMGQELATGQWSAFLDQIRKDWEKDQKTGGKSNDDPTSIGTNSVKNTKAAGGVSSSSTSLGTAVTRGMI